MNDRDGDRPADAAGAAPRALSAFGAEQTAADLDQGLAEADQTSSDADQSASERDDADAEADQQASEHDQAMADRQHRWDADAAALEAYEESRSARDASASRRSATHRARAGTARSRDVTSAERDATALARDEAARLRDERAEAIERSIAASDAPLSRQLARLRARAAGDRARAARDRARAAQDRAEAAAQRARLEQELDRAHLDDLTGAYRRTTGWLALTHEIEHARRGDGRFVLAFVDVDGLKRINDRDGHAAGDRVLVALVTAMRTHLRPFDPIVRYGGDEFVCGLGGADLGEVRHRFDAIDAAARNDAGAGISVGLAALRPGETLDQLAARADAALLEAKRPPGR